MIFHYKIKKESKAIPIVAFTRVGYPKMYDLINFKYSYPYSMWGFTDDWKQYEL